MSNLYRIRGDVLATGPDHWHQRINVTPQLYAVLLYIESRYAGEGIVYTSILRPDDTDSVHGHGRGADIRIWHKDRGIPLDAIGAGPQIDAAKEMCADLNAVFDRWEGGDGKLHDTAIIHGEGLNRHIHIQVPDRAWH